MQAYVGNVAWAHIQALQSLHTIPNIGGQVFYITDASPHDHIAMFIRHFAKSRGERYTALPCPYSLMRLMTSHLETFTQVLFPYFELDLGKAAGVTTAAVTYSSGEYFVSSRRAKEKWNYEPLFTFEEALARSTEYYSRVVIL